MAIDHERLIFRKLLGETTSAEDIELDRWRKADSRHERLYQERKRNWSNQMREAPEFVPGHRPVLLKNRPLVATKRSPAFYAAESVAITLLVIATFLIYSGLSDRPSVYRAGKEMRTVILNDSTRATLRPGSLLMVWSRYGKGSRTVELKGEAAFDVKGDSLNPFEVQSEHSRIRVVGTSFSAGIHPEKGRDEVRVQSGKVSLSAVTDPERVVTVPAGKIGVVHRDNRIITVQDADTTNMIAWKKKELTFTDTPLPEVADALANYFEISVTIESEVIENCTVTGTFKEPAIEDIIDHLQRSLDVVVIREYNGLVIRGERACKVSRRKR